MPEGACALIVQCGGRLDAVRRCDSVGAVVVDDSIPIPVPSGWFVVWTSLQPWPRWYCPRHHIVNNGAGGERG